MRYLRLVRMILLDNMDITWISGLDLGYGDFWVKSCQINGSKLLLSACFSDSCVVAPSPFRLSNLGQAVSSWSTLSGSPFMESWINTVQSSGDLANENPLNFHLYNWQCCNCTFNEQHGLPSHQLSQPTSSVLASFSLFQWLVVHVQSFSRLFLCEVPLVGAPGSWTKRDNPLRKIRRGPSPLHP